jgi:hypothetical protein
MLGGREMRYTPPISDDKWDSWEPLVAGLPLFLWLILFQYGLLNILFLFELAKRVKEFLEAPPLPPSSTTSAAFSAAAWAVVCGQSVWFWLRALKAKRSAIAFWGFMSIMLSVVGAVLLRLLLTPPVEKPIPHWPFVVLAAAASLAALEAVYLFRLRAKLKRLGLP